MDATKGDTRMVRHLFCILKARGVLKSAISGLSESLGTSGIEKVYSLFKVTVCAEIYLISVAISFFVKRSGFFYFLFSIRLLFPIF